MVAVSAHNGNPLTESLAQEDPHSPATPLSRSLPRTRGAFARQGTRTFSPIKHSVAFQQSPSTSRSAISDATSRQDPSIEPTTSTLIFQSSQVPVMNHNHQDQVHSSSRDVGMRATIQPADVEPSDRALISLRQHLKRHARTHETLGDFLLSSVGESSSEFRVRAAELRAEQLGALTSILQNVSGLHFVPPNQTTFLSTVHLPMRA